MGARDAFVAAARGAAWLCVLAFVTVVAAIVGILADEGDLVPGVLIAGAALVPVAVFALGLVRENWWLRLAGWSGMVLALVPLISFAWMLLPFVAAAAPAVFIDRPRSRATSPGRAGP